MPSRERIGLRPASLLRCPPACEFSAESFPENGYLVGESRRNADSAFG